MERDPLLHGESDEDDEDDTTVSMEGRGDISKKSSGHTSPHTLPLGEDGAAAGEVIGKSGGEEEGGGGDSGRGGGGGGEGGGEGNYSTKPIR